MAQMQKIEVLYSIYKNPKTLDFAELDNSVFNFKVNMKDDYWYVFTNVPTCKSQKYKFSTFMLCFLLI